MNDSTPPGRRDDTTHPASTPALPIEGTDDTTRSPLATDADDGTFWNRETTHASGSSAETPSTSAARGTRLGAWARPTAVAVLLALLAGLTFLVVGALVRHGRTASTSAPVTASSPTSPTSASSSSSTSSSAATSSTTPDGVTTTQAAPPAVTQAPEPTGPAVPAPPAPTTATASAASSSASSATSAPTSAPVSSPATSDPADTPFPATTGEHCITADGGTTSVTAPDVRQALTRQSSCGLLLSVRDAVHAKTAANPGLASYPLHVFSAYRKQHEPTTDGYIDLTCSRNGVFVTCVSDHPPVEIWVRDAS